MKKINTCRFCGKKSEFYDDINGDFKTIINCPNCFKVSNTTTVEGWSSSIEYKKIKEKNEINRANSERNE